MSESRFNNRFRHELEKLGVHIYRIESHGTRPGIPDNYYLTQYGKSSGWLEMKCARTTPKLIDYRPYQVPWLLDHSRIGGKCFTVLGIESTREIVVLPGDQSSAASRNLQLAVCRTFHEDRPECYSGILALLEDGWWTHPRTATNRL